MDELKIASHCHSELIKGLQDLYTQRHLVDVVLKVDEKEYPCHRAVLAATSPYFRAMFLANMAEAYSTVIPLHDLDPASVGDVINFCYFGRISINHDNVQNLIITSGIFQMLDLRNLCENYMKKYIDLSNCVDVFTFGEFHGCTVLREAAKNFIMKNFRKLALSEQLCKLSEPCLFDIIRDDDLDIEREEYVFEAVMKWINHNLEEREKYLVKFMEVVRFVHIADEYIADVISKHPLIDKNPFLSGILSVAKLYKSTQWSSNNLDRDLDLDLAKDFQINANRRLGMYAKNMIVFVGGGLLPSCRSFTCFDPASTKSYVGLQPNPTFDHKYKIDNHQLVVTEQNAIYFIGGIFYSDYHFEDEAPAFSDVMRYDPETKTWERCQRMISPRCAFAAVARGDDIVALGGKATFPGGTPMSLVEYYDAEQNNWSAVTPMPFALYHHSAATWRESVFVLGGQTDTDDAQNVNFQYNFETDSWTLLQNMLVPRTEFGIAVVGEEVVVVCGRSAVKTELMSVEAYNPVTNKWRFLKDLPEDRKLPAVVTLDGRLYVCGGQQTHMSRTTHAPRTINRADVWTYDVATDDWTKIPRSVMYPNCHGYGVARVNVKYVREVGNV